MQYGPVGAATLRRWIAEHRVTSQTLALAEGATEWKPLSAFAEFAADFGTGLPPTIPAPGRPGTGTPATTAEKASTKIPAGVCGILLGWLGIHKFILGYTGPGLIMLIVSLLGSIPTCGLAACVMWIIGLVEGTMYLAKSDEDFVRTYIDGRKEWF
ncbi:MAG: NINE protein [Verrucomicrobiales bacterium]|nr:NINE protein [Verrucomicrobiales bacterium]